MRVLVAGAGAVGSWLGAALAVAGADITLVAQDAHGAAMARAGLYALRTPPVHLHPPVYNTVTEAAAHGPYDIAIVAVKSFVTPALAAEWSGLGAPKRVVSFQNGIGNEAILQAALPDCSVIPASLTLAVHVPEPGTVMAWHKGGAGLGRSPQGPDVADLASALAAGGIATRLYDDGADMKWSKMLLNMIGAASSAALGWPPPRLLADRRIFDLELAAWREALAVMRRTGRRAVALPGYPVPALAALGRWLPAACLYRFVPRGVGRERGDRLPGVAVDLARGGEHTEIEVMHGAIAAIGEATDVPTPANSALAATVGDIAAGKLDRAQLLGQPSALLAAVGRRGWPS
jgi:2-dehydropantoate 2-reductase